ncbi:DUF397 domain-containing protein [Sphaerisporangium album]|uniref:DUF397 domain-containing protein n=1 Tax=Sphaerisporangium album TaxID=509200 RepID=A0A367FNP6_9ACTN|nr:DUF397 domain-containing protein [Sphaerisporangium album]RCG32026.1 DUF397 domain-containing protein [Sphaerisporangium album]
MGPRNQLAWRKSTFSTNGENCVEVAKLPDGGKAVRDSKVPTGPVLSFTPGGWEQFTAGVRRGELS